MNDPQKNNKIASESITCDANFDSKNELFEAIDQKSACSEIAKAPLPRAEPLRSFAAVRSYGDLPAKIKDRFTLAGALFGMVVGVIASFCKLEELVQHEWIWKGHSSPSGLIVMAYVFVLASAFSQLFRLFGSAFCDFVFAILKRARDSRD